MFRGMLVGFGWRDGRKIGMPSQGSTILVLYINYFVTDFSTDSNLTYITKTFLAAFVFCVP